MCVDLSSRRSGQSGGLTRLALHQTAQAQLHGVAVRDGVPSRGGHALGQEQNGRAQLVLRVRAELVAQERRSRVRSHGHREVEQLR